MVQGLYKDSGNCEFNSGFADLLFGGLAPVICSYTTRSLDGGSIRYEQWQTRLFTLVAMATITELKCGKRSLSFVIFVSV